MTRPTAAPTRQTGSDAVFQVDAGGETDFESEAAANVDLTGTWSIVCCYDVYHGFVMLTQVGTTITGTYHDITVGTGGIIVGAIHGSHVEFTRTFVGIYQVYSLTVSDDGDAITGTLSGKRTICPWVSMSR